MGAHRYICVDHRVREEVSEVIDILTGRRLAINNCVSLVLRERLRRGRRRVGNLLEGRVSS